MNKNLIKISYIGLGCLGYLIYLITTLVISIQFHNTSLYGISAFGPFLLSLVIGIVSLVLILLTSKKRKKNKTKPSYTIAIVPLVLLFIVYVVLELVLPTPLIISTQGTIIYEDIIENSMGVHEELMEKVEQFKKKNGISSDIKLKDKKFQDIFYSMYPSMDKAFNSYSKVAIDLALKFPDLADAISTGKLPLGTLASLLLKTAPNDEHDNPTLDLSDLEDIKTLVGYNLFSILGAVNFLKNNIDDISNPEV